MNMKGSANTQALAPAQTHTQSYTHFFFYMSVSLLFWSKGLKNTKSNNSCTLQPTSHSALTLRIPFISVMEKTKVLVPDCLWHLVVLANFPLVGEAVTTGSMSVRDPWGKTS